jgi:hypothetical protein
MQPTCHYCGRGMEHFEFESIIKKEDKCYTHDIKRSLNTFINNKIKFGDYILFQEYIQDKYEGDKYHYKISKPILAIYLGCFVADQTIGFNYVRWNNENHIVYITNEHVTKYPVNKEVEEIESHIEWNDYIDILGHWENKPKWKEIIKSYRKQNLKQYITEDEINWD